MSENVGNKSWVFVINNYTEDDITCVKAVPCQRIVCFTEVGESGTPHLSGAVIFTRNIRMKAVCTALGGRASCHKMKGTWAQQDYHIKEGRTMIRMEDNSKQGQRTDLKRFYSDIMEGKDEEQIAVDNLGAYCKYTKAYNRLCFLRDKKRARKWRDVKVIVLSGKTGHGKTKRAMDDGAYLWSPCKPEWWDGYDRDDVICIDEFYGQIPISRLLRLLDGHPVRLPVKGGFTWAMWTKVYITSNVKVEDWYLGVPEGVRAALKRRISEIIKF